MRKTLLKGLALLLIGISPMLSGCSSPPPQNFETYNAQIESQLRESERLKKAAERERDKYKTELYDLKAQFDLLSDEEKRNLEELRETHRERFVRNVTEATGRRWLAENKVEIETLKQKIALEDLKILKYEWALKKLGFDPYEVERQTPDSTQSPFELAKARMERDRAGFEMERIGWERDRSYLQLEISKLQKTIYDAERAQYPMPKPKN